MPCRGRNLRLKNDKTGFSLVELLMVVAISSIVIAIIANIYIAQSKRYATIDSIANIQQDLRGVLAILPMEIRLAGCDPTKSNVPGIITATSNSFRFTMDTKDNSIPRLNVSDGQVNGDEDIAYGFAGNGDNNGDGIADNGGADWSGTASLGRGIGGGALQPLADNIEALEFCYLIDDDNDASTPPVQSLAPANPNQIRAVQVSILARAANPDRGYLNTSTYTTASGVVWDPPDDHFHRRLEVINIQCRNKGL
ncbi:MAG: PilW family protein, partial [Desulfocapsaceae bacterium]|nr:PilW family protein [Desulfocapsaceae bacterium]